MRKACGAESKRSSAGCCVQKNDDSDHQAISPEPFSFDNDRANTGVAIPFVAEMNLHRAGRVTDWQQTHPPGTDLSETTRLRI
jgi:hypothetical protein